MRLLHIQFLYNALFVLVKESYRQRGIFLRSLAHVLPPHAKAAITLRLVRCAAKKAEIEMENIWSQMFFADVIEVKNVWVVFLLALFPLLWMLILWVIAEFGWAKLARRYPLRGTFHGQVRTFQSGVIGAGARYNGVLAVGWGEQGLFLHVFVLFRINHPPLLIPWEEIEEAILDRHWFTDRLRLRMGAPDVPALTLFGGVARLVLEAYQRESER